MYKLEFLVPLDTCEHVKEAVFNAGAGHVGNYEACGWQTYGSGQFKPLKGSQPAVGIEGVLTRCPEIKVECIVAEEVIDAVVKALVESHPYETVAHAYWRINEPVT